MTRTERLEQKRRLLDLLRTQTADIARRESDRTSTMRDLREHAEASFREIGAAAGLNHQTVANRLTAAAKEPQP